MDFEYLTGKERTSLLLFNNICGSLRGEYSNDAKGLMKIWEVTLYIFKEEFKEPLLNTLLSALKKRRPHWNNELEKYQTSYEKILYHFYKCCKSLDTLSDGYYSTNSIFSYQGKEHSPQNHCMVHPEKKSRTGQILCETCYKKLLKLDLKDYPVDYGLLYNLKNKNLKKSNLVFCINHPNKLALGNNLCEQCNIDIDRLEHELNKADIITNVIGKLE